jgi:DNA polymerase-3 subunit gamma/tau
MNKIQVNLARKWRSKQFDEVIGQPLVIRLIKNSLYRGLIFPVYLFSGTRGCGKTSTARLFAAALNCEQLGLFKKNPQKHVLPCLSCPSCLSMQRLQHPDFVEIDAASHTGVDNIRQIIDAASFVPTLGNKKIYLIDEAHMLSKAAFNALLKILEEPPMSVVFMLATTDEAKIIDTVRSRCFQLYFYPISPPHLVEHLIAICTEESIGYERDALLLIAQETGGSVRDAINLIERIRLVCTTITKQVVYETLGFIDEQRLCVLFKALISGSCADVLTTWQSLHPEKLNALILWKKFIDLVRVALLIKNRITQDVSYSETISASVHECSLEKLIKILEITSSYELQLTKAANAVLVLELMFVKIWQELSILPMGTSGSAPKSNVGRAHVGLKSISAPVVNAIAVVSTPWESYVKDIEMTQDPLVISVFKQGTSVLSQLAHNKLIIKFGSNLTFFKEWLERTKGIWQPLLAKHFGENIHLETEFTNPPVAAQVPRQAQKPQNEQHVKSAAVGQIKSTQQPKFVSATVSKEKERAININDSAQWPKAQTLLKIFPGTVTYIEGQYE